MLPDFLGIGAPRTGMTWLYENLRRHPEVWLPPIKEIHYFYCGNFRPSLAQWLSGANVAHRRNRRRLAKELWKAALGQRPNDAA